MIPVAINYCGLRVYEGHKNVMQIDYWLSCQKHTNTNLFFNIRIELLLYVEAFRGDMFL